MKPVNLKRERGAALLAMLAVIMLLGSWFLVSQLNAETGGMTAINRTRNAAVLNRAKQALIGYVAAQAADSTERNPGRLPCPEGASYVGVANSEGIAWNGFGTDCASVGRLPWRTLGLEKLLDTSSEPLWYAVGPTWRLSSSDTTLKINSNTIGDISVDGQNVVALIIAPGAAIDAQAATGCTAKNQARSAPSSSIDATNYLECFDAGTLTFKTTAASSSYNDQVVRITVADIMPAIEAAIANRIERQILLALQTVYTPSAWGFSGSNPVLPFAAPFASPGSGAGTSNYHGASGTYAGLLPFNQMRNCTVSAADPRCTSTVLTYSKASADVLTAGTSSIRTQSVCAWQSAIFVCTGEYWDDSVSGDASVAVTLSIRVANVAGGLRTLDLSKVTCTAVDDAGLGDPVKTVTCSVSAAMQSDGSVIITAATSALPDVSGAGWNTYANYKVNIDEAAFGDHALLGSTDPTPYPGSCPSYGCTGWFVRNEWYRLLYYAVSQGNTAAQLPSERSCTTPGNCLTITNLTPTSKSAALILAGRSINGSTRPSATIGDYLEFGNAGGAYERQSVTPGSAMIYADTGTANAYTVAVTTLATGANFQFRALSANTGNSTLSTTATGTRNLLNRDLSNLAAGTIRANAAVEVTWDGTQFLLSKRPFNDRFAALAAN